MDTKAYLKREIKNLYEFVESNEDFDYVLHHVNNTLQMEDSLKRKIKACRNNQIGYDKVDGYLKKLSNAGVLDCKLTPNSDLLRYKTSSLGDKVKLMIKQSGSRYNHK